MLLCQKVGLQLMEGGVEKRMAKSLQPFPRSGEKSLLILLNSNNNPTYHCTKQYWHFQVLK